MAIKTRKELTQAEVEIHKNAIISSIKKDFLSSDVSFQPAALMKHVAGYIRESENSSADVRAAIKELVNGSMVAVGNGQVAVVKRPDVT